jgi:hypothetical protein
MHDTMWEGSHHHITTIQDQTTGLFSEIWQTGQCHELQSHYKLQTSSDVDRAATLTNTKI